jgi:hypothetical protein
MSSRKRRNADERFPCLSTTTAVQSESLALYLLRRGFHQQGRSFPSGSCFEEVYALKGKSLAPGNLLLSVNEPHFLFTRFYVMLPERRVL